MAEKMPPLPPGAVAAKPQTSLPPLPQGAKSATTLPPLPKGAQPAQPQISGKTSQSPGVMDYLTNLGGFKSYGQEYSREANEAMQALRGDVTSPVQGRKGAEPGFWDYAARAGVTGLDALNYLWTPAHAAFKTYLGRPVEEMGGPKAEVVAGAADILAPFGPKMARSTPELVSKIGSGAKKVAAPVEKLFSPTTVSPEAGAVERIIRKSGGEQSLKNEQAASRLVEHNKTLSNMPVAEQRAFVDDIENGRTPADPKLAAAAKDIRGVYDDWKAQVQKVLPASAQPNFIENYYSHIWKEKPSVVAEKLGTASRQGSGRSFKARTIPTISEGIKAGLTPKFENPVETTMAYSQNMARYVATHDMLNEMKTQGYAKWFSPGSPNVPKGWVPLEGIMTKKTAPVTIGTAKASIPRGSNTGKPLATGRPIQLYAPEPAARVFNNFISRGLEQGDYGPFYEAARKASNGLMMLKLGLSTFHLGTMANEAVISEMARGISAASRGRVLEGAKAFAKSPAAPVLSARRGLKMQKELLEKAMPDAMSKKVNDAFVRAGQTLRMDPFYRTRASGSFYNAIEKGTLKRELKDAADKLYKGTPYENAKGAVDLGANIIQSTAAPLFEKYIPLIKRGAFASRMEDFLKENPGASKKEIDKAAVSIADSIDNRFGELNQDNLFWHRGMKQMAQILLLSPTWNLGTLREIGGGIKDAMGSLPDVFKGKGVTDRTAYVAALAAQVALMNGIATYMKTGTMPHGKDFMAYRTGGTDAASGKPERAMTPGYQKDVYAFGYDFPHHILQEAENKLNPALSAAIGVMQNKDYRGLPVYRPHGVAPIAGEPTAMDLAMDTLLPISIGQFSQGAKVGSNLSLPERVMSIRPAPGYITDTERQQRLQTLFGTKDWKRRIRADQRQKAMQK